MAEVLSPDWFEEKDRQSLFVRHNLFLDDHFGSDDCLVFVLSGLIGVYASDALVNRVEAGDVFGICNLFLPSALPLRLKALEDSSLILVRKDKVRSYLLSHQDALVAYTRFTNQKIQFLLSRIALLSLPTAKEKVSAYLLGETREFSSRDELAAYLGISRASLFRELGAWVRKGAISTDQNGIRILDKEKII